MAKSTHPERLAANIDIFDIALSDDERTAIAALDRQAPNASFDHRDPRMFEAILSFESPHVCQQSSACPATLSRAG